ncbi:unnamed protein product [Chrysoparadoxa australica]
MVRSGLDVADRCAATGHILYHLKRHCTRIVLKLESSSCPTRTSVFNRLIQQSNELEPSHAVECPDPLDSLMLWYKKCQAEPDLKGKEIVVLVGNTEGFNMAVLDKLLTAFASRIHELPLVVVFQVSPHLGFPVRPLSRQATTLIQAQEVLGPTDADVANCFFSNVIKDPEFPVMFGPYTLQTLLGHAFRSCGYSAVWLSTQLQQLVEYHFERFTPGEAHNLIAISRGYLHAENVDLLLRISKGLPSMKEKDISRESVTRWARNMIEKQVTFRIITAWLDMVGSKSKETFLTTSALLSNNELGEGHLLQLEKAMQQISADGLLAFLAKLQQLLPSKNAAPNLCTDIRQELDRLTCLCQAAGEKFAVVYIKSILSWLPLFHYLPTLLQWKLGVEKGHSLVNFHPLTSLILCSSWQWKTGLTSSTTLFLLGLLDKAKDLHIGPLKEIFWLNENIGNLATDSKYKVRMRKFEPLLRPPAPEESDTRPKRKGKARASAAPKPFHAPEIAYAQLAKRGKIVDVEGWLADFCDAAAEKAGTDGKCPGSKSEMTTRFMYAADELYSFGAIKPYGKSIQRVERVAFNFLVMPCSHNSSI